MITQFLRPKRMGFDEDGAIKPITLTNQGVDALFQVPARRPKLALVVIASTSSIRSDGGIRFTAPSPGRTETFSPDLAIDA